MLVNRQRKKKDLRGLKKQGFDLSAFDEVNQTWKVKCSKCEAGVLNGYPCHEVGCSNNSKK